MSKPMKDSILVARQTYVVSSLLLFLVMLTVHFFDTSTSAVSNNLGLRLVLNGLLTRTQSDVIEGQYMLARSTQKRWNSFVVGSFEPDNLILNGSFEFNAVGWIIDGANGVRPVLSNNIAYDGNNSLSVKFDGQDVNFYQTYQEIPVLASSCYLLQAQVYTENLTDSVGMDVWDSQRGYQYWYGGVSNLVSGTQGWTRISLSFCTGSDVDSIQVRLRRFGGKGKAVSGTAWFDALRLSEALDSEH